ncbi:MAG: DUF5522 domain-containing protein [Myxococcota bacterium]
MSDDLHARACEAGLLRYTDPQTGYQVFTALAHEKRGKCCGCGCRHCPFGHRDVQGPRPASRDPWLLGQDTDDRPCDVLFWSGGKDSYLALRALQREGQRPVVLMTTFEDASEIVAHQGVTMPTIQAQAQALDLPIVLTPLFPHRDYLDRVQLGLRTLRRRRPIVRLAFGDLHLESIRDWRRRALAPLVESMGVQLCFPVWKRPYPELTRELAEAPVRCHICAVDERVDQVIAIGDPYDDDLIARLPEGVDAFGENGEFHTCIEPVGA